MAKTVLKLENISKLYRLGEVGTGTISHDLNRWWHKVRGKEDPYQQIGSLNQRDQKGDTDYVWALKDINLEVKEGEILGIIGANGAGKSTLLKILSKVTAPTTGRIRGKGKISALLEVGTGFHPELTARENIYLNGAILGMRRHEITAQLDEIVDFAGIERYLDTPVKRFSSGMMVRLGFAVAAHLQTDILIIDEVLAVGDAEFQQKCIGKIGEISEGQGKTVLFVSHNMETIRKLCKKTILLVQGKLKTIGKTEEVFKDYKLNNDNTYSDNFIFIPQKNKISFIEEVRIKSSQNRKTKSLFFCEPLFFEIKLVFKQNIGKVYLLFYINDYKGTRIVTNDSSDNSFFIDTSNPCTWININHKNLQLTPGNYNIGIGIIKRKGVFIDHKKELSFKIENMPISSSIKYTSNYGLIRNIPEWSQKNSVF